MAEKVYHLAAHVARSGEVSAACYVRARPINMAKESWTLRHEAVTCARCKKTERFAEAVAKEGGR